MSKLAPHADSQAPVASERHERRQRWMARGVLVLILVPPGALFLSLTIGMWQFLANPFGRHSEPAAIDPSASFLQLTGWQLPDGTSVLKNINSHSGFKNDGDYTLIIQMRPGQLQSLLADDSHTWVDCPVAPDIVKGAWRLPDHDGDTYWARRTAASDTDWHRGHIVIEKQETGMVWVYEWKH